MGGVVFFETEDKFPVSTKMTTPSVVLNAYHVVSQQITSNLRLETIKTTVNTKSQTFRQRILEEVFLVTLCLLRLNIAMATTNFIWLLHVSQDLLCVMDSDSKEKLPHVARGGFHQRKW